jgi:metal transporter CNNM
MSPFVLILMWLMAPVAWPTAKLLDYLLGEDHGTTYKKAGLKTLVSLHRSLGETGQQLNADEVTIISAVLDLKDKTIGSIMTPMDDVFTLSLDDVLDESTMDEILSQGYSRIPIHHPDNDANFVGMLLVKMLITYDPEDAKPVRDFALATLPETRPDTSCLDIVNFFQEGKSHMVLVSEYPGEDHGALGVVTLEDVIEELIGEEIVDESDVFVDVHKAIRRSMAAPFRRIPKTYILPDEPSTIAVPAADLIDINEGETLTPNDLQKAQTAENPPKTNKEIIGTRRRSSAGASYGADNRPARRGASTDEIKEHLKHLGPSNLASRPRTTRYNTVKIKPGTAAVSKPEGPATPIRRISETASEYRSGIGEGLLSSGGKNASGGVQALKQGYGSVAGSPNERRPASANKAGQTGSQTEDGNPNGVSAKDINPERPPPRTRESESTVGSLPESRPQSRSPYYQHKGPARSGSITENIIDTNGFRKVVLEMTSSSESNEEEDNSGANKNHHSHDERTSSSSTTQLRGSHEEHDQHEDGKKKKRRRRKHARGSSRGERQPLLGN